MFICSGALSLLVSILFQFTPDCNGAPGGSSNYIRFKVANQDDTDLVNMVRRLNNRFTVDICCVHGSTNPSISIPYNLITASTLVV